MRNEPVLKENLKQRGERNPPTSKENRMVDEEAGKILRSMFQRWPMMEKTMRKSSSNLKATGAIWKQLLYPYRVEEAEAVLATWINPNIDQITAPADCLVVEMAKRRREKADRERRQAIEPRVIQFSPNANCAEMFELGKSLPKEQRREVIERVI